MFMVMDLTTSNIVMKGIFLLVLAIIGGYVANTLGCKTQKLMETNMAVKHIVTIMIVYFAMDLSSQFQEKQISPFENLKLSFIIYFFVALTVANIFELPYTLIEYLKILSKTFIVLGIFCIGLQSSKIEYKELSFKPLVLALIVWLCVIPMAYFISVS